MEFLQNIFTQISAKAQGSRSTALQPVLYLVGILTTALVTSAFYGVSSWIIGFIATVIGVVIAVFLFVFVYFAFVNPDAIRSERFVLSKMAINQHLIGDNSSGLKEINPSDKTTGKLKHPGEDQ